VGIKTAAQLRDIASSQDGQLNWKELSELNRISHALGAAPGVLPW